MPSDRPQRDQADDAEAGVSPQILWILWGSLLGTIGIYGAITQFIEVSHPMESGPLTTMSIVLATVSVAEMPVIWFLRRLTLWKRLDDGQFDEETSVGAAYFTTCVMTWALCESIAIYGFVLAFLSGDIQYYLPFAAVGAALMVVFRPDLNGVLESFREQQPDSSDVPEASNAEW